jgi:lipid-A-disaccharide synthase
MKYYLVAGERSGDLHASNLMKALRRQDPNAVFRGLGGQYMESAGADLFMNYHEIAVMGFVEVIKNLFRFRKILYDCRDDIVQFDADVVILVDFAGFNLRLARLVKHESPRVFYYISPKIWAWNTKRVHKVKKYVDAMFVILPFESDFYKQYDVAAHYVGNPVVDAVQDFAPAHSRDKYFGEDCPGVALLPGSRRHEISTILPLMLQLAASYPDMNFAVSAVRNIPEALYDTAAGYSNVRIIYEDNYHLLHHADYAIVASGTATLETALFDVPQIVVYRLNPINWIIGRIFVKLKYVSLVNLIAGRKVVEELLQKRFSLENLQREFDAMRSNPAYVIGIRNGYGAVKRILGEESASKKAAELIIKILGM